MIGVTPRKTLRTPDPATITPISKERIEGLLRRSGSEGDERAFRIAGLVQRGLTRDDGHIREAMEYYKGLRHYAEVVKIALMTRKDSEALENARQVFEAYKAEVAPVEGRLAPSVKGRAAKRRKMMEEQMTDLVEFLPQIENRDGALRLYRDIAQYVRGQRLATPFEENFLRALTLAVKKAPHEHERQAEIERGRADALRELHSHYAGNDMGPAAEASG